MSLSIQMNGLRTRGERNCTEKLSHFDLNKLKIGTQHPCFIVAEIGQNHQGDLQNAKELILLAKVNAKSQSKILKVKEITSLNVNGI